MVACSAPSSLGWIDEIRKNLKVLGYALVPSVLDLEFVRHTKVALERAQQGIWEEIGRERLVQAGELGVLRIPMKFDPHFFRFLELPELLAVVDATVGDTAIMHLQNGFILPSYSATPVPTVFQNNYHQDFPRFMNGYLASINIFYALDAFTASNGATWLVPGSHQQPDRPNEASLNKQGFPIECPAGSMLIFDSTLWHSAGHNTSGMPRYAINHQFTRSFIKQQIDYVRALDEKVILQQQPRTQQLLGYYSRVVTSLEEYTAQKKKGFIAGGRGSRDG